MDLFKKRKLYACGKKFYIIQEILTWTSYFFKNLQPESVPDVKGMFAVSPSLNEKVSLWQGDITALEIDGIVNAANESLLGGGGVDGCIHSAAGSELLEACEKLNGCSTGESRVTPGFNLPAKYVIHAVGPQTEDYSVLEKAYQNALSSAVSNSLRTVAFPCISTGIFGLPREQAAHTALRTTRHFLENNENKFDRIIFVTYLEEDLRIYEKLMQRYFPLS